MSTDRNFIDDRDRPRIPDDAPLRDVVPDDFVARSSAATLRAALLEAEAATSRTEAELPRCPDCGSIHIERKTVGQATTHATDYRCTTCSAQFDEPAPSREAARKGEQVTFRDVKRKAAGSFTAADSDDERLGVEKPAFDDVADSVCADWRRELQGMEKAIGVFATENHWEKAVKPHVKGWCDCEHDVPALKYEREGHRGQAGKWVER